MTSLDDLLRDTLAERAHDVDGLTLIAPTTHPRRTGRWTAVATVVAVAAALVVAVVLLAPWRGASDRNATAPAVSTPPAGMQWVSYHGITLTVPDSWAVGTFFCTRPATSAVVVPSGTFAPSCPYNPNTPTTPLSATVVYLSALGNAPPQGDQITIDNRPALRFVSDGGPSKRDQQQVQIPAAGVYVDIDAPDVNDQTVLTGIRYTPVDANGCIAQLSADPVPDSLPSGPVEFGKTTGGVICEYSTIEGDRYLVGSRPMTDADLSALRTAWAKATPWTESARGNGFISVDTRAYRITRPNGTGSTLVAQGIGEAVGVTDGSHRAVLSYDDVDVPSAYTR